MELLRRRIYLEESNISEQNINYTEIPFTFKILTSGNIL